MFIDKMADHDGNHRCLIEKNVPIAFILPNRWHDGAESLVMERPQAVYDSTFVNYNAKCSLIDVSNQKSSFKSVNSRFLRNLFGYFWGPD